VVITFGVVAGYFLRNRSRRSRITCMDKTGDFAEGVNEWQSGVEKKQSRFS